MLGHRPRGRHAPASSSPDRQVDLLHQRSFHHGPQRHPVYRLRTWRRGSGTRTEREDLETSGSFFFIASLRSLSKTGLPDLLTSGILSLLANPKMGGSCCATPACGANNPETNPLVGDVAIGGAKNAALAILAAAVMALSSLIMLRQ